MADEKLRRELISLGYTPGPITESTRRVLEKKLEKLRADAKKTRNSSDNVRRSRREPHHDRDDDETWETPDLRSQPEKEREPWGPVREERGWRVEGSRDLRTDISPVPTEERTLWARERASLPGNDPERSAAGHYRYSGDNQLRSSLGHHRYSGDNSETSSPGPYTYPGDNQLRSSLGPYRYSGDIHERSSLDHHRYSGDIHERSSLDHHRYSDDIHERSALDHHRYSGDIPDRSSLDHRRYSGDLPDRSSLDHHKYSVDSQLRSSLGHYMYSGEIPARSSLDHHKYSDDSQLRSSLGPFKYSGHNPERSSLDHHRYSSENQPRSSLDHSRYPGYELRYRLVGDQSSSPLTPRIRTAVDALSYKTHSSLKQENVSYLKPGWSKKLEYYLSRLLRVLCVILILVFTGILIVRSGILSTSQDNGMKLLPSDCEGRKDTFCKAKQKEITLRILSELYDFLSLEAGSFECGNPSGLNSKCVPINRAEEHVMNVSGYAAENFAAAMEWMLSSDRHLGIWAKGEDTEELVTERTEIFCVESSRPRLGFVCRLKNALYTAISNLFLALLGLFILWIILIFLKFHWQTLEEEEKQMFAMVEKIIDVVKHHYKDWTLGREQNPYVGILHVRDSLIMPQDRKLLKKVWDHAVQFVEDNESRVRTELQRVAGADLMVWRWTRNDAK